MEGWRRSLVAASVLAAGSAAALADPLPRTPPAKPASPCGPGGGLALPGSDTCVRIGGFVRAEGSATSHGTPAAPGIVPTARPHRTVSSTWRRPEAQVEGEGRTETPYGPLRAYLSVRMR